MKPFCELLSVDYKMIDLEEWCVGRGNLDELPFYFFRRLKEFYVLNRGDYIGQKLRENGFDPKGKGSTSMLDDLVGI